jgi:hypothetical protein
MSGYVRALTIHRIVAVALQYKTVPAATINTGTATIHAQRRERGGSSSRRSEASSCLSSSMSSRESSGRTPQCVQPADFSRQAAEDADPNWHVQPVRFPVAESDLKKHNHEEPDTDARHPSRYAAPPPQHDGGDPLDECAKLHHSLRKSPSKRSPRRNTREAAADHPDRGPHESDGHRQGDDSRPRPEPEAGDERQGDISRVDSSARRDERGVCTAADPGPFAGGDHSRRRPKVFEVVDGRARLLTVLIGATRQYQVVVPAGLAAPKR